MKRKQAKKRGGLVLSETADLPTHIGTWKATVNADIAPDTPK